MRHPITGVKPRIFFANHSSHLDFLVIWSALPGEIRRFTRPVAAADYWLNGALRKAISMNLFNAVLVDRQSSNAGQVLRSDVEQVLGCGQSVLIFPEGTRSIDGSLQRFKSGLYFIAQAHPEVELVPVCLRNLNRLLPKGEFIPLPLLSYVTFGSPLHRNREETKEDFLRRAESSIRELMP